MRATAVLRGRLAINSLWSLWYCVLVLALTVYLAKCNIQSYGHYWKLPWIPTSQPWPALRMYLGLTVIALIMLPGFLLASTLLIGNMANDGRKMGKNVSLVGDARRSRLRWLWRYTLPPSHVIHVLMAFCLLMARLIMEAELVRHGFLQLGTYQIQVPNKITF